MTQTLPATRMPYRHEIEFCFEDRIGACGLGPDDYEPVLAATAPGLEALRAAHGAGSLPLLALPERRDDLAAIRAVAERLGAFRRVLVVGTGGASLGGRALAALAPPEAQARLAFLDNLDGEAMAALLAGLEAEATGVVAISKSGATVETLAQTALLVEFLAGHLGDDAVAGHVAAIAEPGDSPLRRLAARYGVEVLDHDPNLGGRFSVLSLTGLLPAALLGLDGAALRAGAAEALARTLAANRPGEAPAAVGAALNVALSRAKAAHIAVLWPYLDRLAAFAAWHRQLWAESLGKGGHGTTPAPALGPVDQHSQLQLYLDGPKDKFFTLILGAAAGTGPRLDGVLGPEPELAALAGRTVGDIVAAQQEATCRSLADHGCPVRVLRLTRLDEFALGALFMHFMLETILAAGLLGVDPYGQPAVEAGKALARRLLAEGAGR